MEVLELLEDVMGIYSLTNVRIFTDKIVEYAQYMREPTKSELLRAIENSEMVLEYARKRGKESQHSKN